MESGDPLVTAEWLKEHISAPDVRVVDATWFPPFLNPEKTGRQAWAEGHIPGAVYFDIDAIKAGGTDLPHMLPDPVMFSSRARKLGLGDGNRIIVYDQFNFFASARVWWMLRVMGQRDVKVLDGGLKAWTDAGGETEDLPPVAVERHFTARVRSDLLKDSDQMLAASANSSHNIIDSRRSHPRQHLPALRRTPHGRRQDEIRRGTWQTVSKSPRAHNRDLRVWRVCRCHGTRAGPTR